MKLVWHIVKKDFRRLWGPLALWTLLLIAKGEVGVRALASDGGEERVFYFSLCENTLVVLGVIVNLLLVAALVQEDALVGTGMFWVTRPISGGRLLAAKLLGAALMFGVLPVVAAVRWWLVCGYGLPEMEQATVGIADGQIVTVGSALVLAALTKNISQFLAWVVGLSVGVVGWIAWLGPNFPWPQREVSWGVSETREVLMVALVVIGGAVVITHQFVTRRLVRTRLLAEVVVGLIAVASMLPWDFSRRWIGAPYNPARAEGISVEVTRVKLEPTATVEIAFRGVPDGFGVRVNAAQKWRWPDGTIAWAQKDSLTGSWPGRAEWRALGLPGDRSGAVARAYAAAGPRGAQDADGITAVLPLFLSPEKVARLQTEPAVYTGELQVGLVRPEIEFELPLRAGERRATPGFSVRIGQSKWVDGEWKATVVESRPSFARDGFWRSHLGALFGLRSAPSAAFALVNREKGEAVKLWRSGGERMQVGGQELRWDGLHGQVPREAEAENAETAPRWLGGATLAVMRYREEARFDREIRLERFPTSSAAEKAKDQSP